MNAFKYLIKQNGNPTLLEEIVDAANHGIGVVLSVIALIVLIFLAKAQNDMWKLVSSAIYAGTLITAYISSSLYHGFQSPKLKRFFHRLDHLSIYLLIAGTYTPLSLVSLRHDWGWPLLAAIWSMAILGIVLKCCFMHRFQRLSTLTYLVMGWLAIVAIKPIYSVLPFAGFMWLIAGGLCYSLGVIFFLWERLRFGHTLWHLFVLAGSTCHFILILLYVIKPIAE